MKVFISQAMHGLQNMAVRAKRERIKELCREAYAPVLIDFIDQVNLMPIPFPDGASITKKRITYLSRSIGLMADADLIVFVDDPEAAPGTSVEFCIAKRYGIEYVYSSQLEGMIKHKKGKSDKNESSNSG